MRDGGARDGGARDGGARGSTRAPESSAGASDRPPTSSEKPPDLFSIHKGVVVSIFPPFVSKRGASSHLLSQNVAHLPISCLKTCRIFPPFVSKRGASSHLVSQVSGADFGIFVRVSGCWDVMVHITQLDEEKLRRGQSGGQSGGKSGGKSGGGIPNLIDVYQKGLECFVKISAVDGVSRKAKVQASLTSPTSLTSLTSLTLACRPHGPSPHVYPYITAYGFSERHVSYPHLFHPFVSPISFTHFFHPFLSQAATPLFFQHVTGSVSSTGFL